MQFRGPWSEERVASFLDGAVIPVRLAVVPSSGFPLVLSLWFLARGTTLYCATSRDAYVTKVLRSNPRCAFEVASERPPYKGIRGQGEARLDDGAGQPILEELLRRYGVARTSTLGRRLLDRAHNETAIIVRPIRITSWDFTARMADVDST
jgi:hypothetical protein